MSKNYVPRSLNEFLKESTSIPLKRKYGERPAITAGINAPIRNRVLSFVAESQVVTKRDLKQFIIGLKEGGATVASANMFITRNAKYFITESRNGTTYFKLSNLGKRLINQFAPQANSNVSESENPINARYHRMNENIGFTQIDEDEDDEASDMDDEGPAEDIEFADSVDADDDELGDEDLENTPESDSGDNFEYEEDDEKITLTYYKKKSPDYDEDETEEYDFKDKGRPGLNDMDESLTAKRKARMYEIIENLKANSLNEAESDEADELSDTDLDKEDDDQTDEINLDDDNIEGEQPEEIEKVEITEFIITVDDVDSAIEELGELGINAERVPVEQPETEVPQDTEEPAPTPDGEGIDNLDLSPEEPAAASEAIRAFYNKNYALNEAEMPADDLGLGDQGQPAAELTNQPAQPTEPEQTVEPTTEFDEHKIKVPAEHWDALKGWLEEKGVDVREMFGGDIETEEYESPEEAEIANTTPEVSDDEIDFSGIGEKDATKLKDEETKKN